MMPHWVLSCKPGWSHFRTLCVLTARIVSHRPIIATILVSNVPGLVERVSAEVRRCLSEETDRVSMVNIRIVALPTSEADTDAAFRRIWQALIEESPISDGLETSSSVATAPRPSLVILDGFQLPWMRIIRSIEHAPPVLQWMMGFSGGFLRMCGPTEMGGRGDLLRLLEPHERPVFAEPCGEVVSLPGMPAMYDWEFYPQDIGSKMEMVLGAEARMSRFIWEADGLITNGAIACDGEECLNSISRWINAREGRKTFHVGPMIPVDPESHRFSLSTIEAELASIPGNDSAKALGFLDRALEIQGPRSVVYISFGTEHWPASMSQIRMLLSALKQRQIPFLFAYSFPGAEITDDIRMEFATLGLFVRHGPQQSILAHEACGWFLTHGGANGSMEALSQGVPLIGWPFAVDQPVNIARLTRDLDVGFELTEVRTGKYGLQPLYRSGKRPSGTAASLEQELGSLLDAMTGEDGKIKRAKAERIRAELGQSWSKNGGAARKEFGRFLDFWLTV